VWNRGSVTGTTGRDRWLQARTLNELGAAMAAWLQGEINFQPAYGGPEPDPETAELVPVLAQINRAGYLTDFSQPGERTADASWTQRAAVTGFCGHAIANQLRARLIATDLIVLTFDPLSFQFTQIVVSLDGAAENTWVGGPLDDDNIIHFYGEDVHPDGVEALRAAWQVHILDPTWGRNDYLWPQLLDALNN
jgi:hypothetical protein